MQSQSGLPELSANGRGDGAFPPERILKPEDFVSRHSNGLDQFFSYIKGESGLSILDLAGANQANVSFITNLGHKIYSEDFLRGLRGGASGDARARVGALLSQH